MKCSTYEDGRLDSIWTYEQRQWLCQDVENAGEPIGVWGVRMPEQRIKNMLAFLASCDCPSTGSRVEFMNWFRFGAEPTELKMIADFCRPDGSGYFLD